MSYPISFLPEVEEDVLNGYFWYENKAKGLGEEFLRVFYVGVADLSRNPLLFRKVYKDFRRCLLRRFPYSIYYRTDENRVIIFGLFHCARNPIVIKRELKER
jgi:plasmid stabilization system protein ParE